MGLMISRLSKWVVTFFPSLNPSISEQEARDKAIILVSTGRMAIEALRGKYNGRTLDGSIETIESARAISIAMLEAYGEILMEQHGIKESEILDPDSTMKFADRVRSGKYKVN